MARSVGMQQVRRRVLLRAISTDTTVASETGRLGIVARWCPFSQVVITLLCVLHAVMCVCFYRYLAKANINVV